jgi:hypothetical protein
LVRAGGLIKTIEFSDLPQRISDKINIYHQGGGGGNAKATVLLYINQISFLVDHLIPFLSVTKLVTEKLKDFESFKLAGYLVSSGKHNTASGMELIVKIAGGLNSYRLSTSTLNSGKEGIPQQ